jgi:hypothetical protein
MEILPLPFLTGSHSTGETSSHFVAPIVFKIIPLPHVEAYDATAFFLKAPWQYCWCQSYSKFIGKRHTYRYIVWDITPCSPLKVNRHFGGIYHLQLQARRISRARNQREAGSKQSSTMKMEAACFLRNVD